MNPEDIQKRLFNTEAANQPVDATLLDQYKLYVDSADKISERRDKANSFFLTINTGVFVLLGYLFSKDTAAELRPLFWAVPIFGIALSVFWFQIVRSYRNLNTAKFTLIHSIESRLPLALYKTEWGLLEEGKSRKKYTPISHIEIWIPWLIAITYLLILLYFVPFRKLWSAISHESGRTAPQPVQQYQPPILREGR